MQAEENAAAAKEAKQLTANEQQVLAPSDAAAKKEKPLGKRKHLAKMQGKRGSDSTEAKGRVGYSNKEFYLELPADTLTTTSCSSSSTGPVRP